MTEASVRLNQIDPLASLLNLRIPCAVEPAR